MPLFKRTNSSLHHWTISQLVFTYSLGLLLIYILLNIVVAGYFVIYPVVKRSVEDFSQQLTENSVVWHQADTSRKQQLNTHWLQQESLVFSDGVSSSLRGSLSFLPYNLLLTDQLQQQLAIPINVYNYGNNEYLIEFAEPVSYFVIFSQSRIGTSPPLFILTIFLIGIGICVLASYFMAQRVGRYFKPLMKASKELSEGRSPAKIDEIGPQEIRGLSRNFNQMATDVQQLIQNRTTLLTGVSHNLRTPVARLKLAMALLPDETDESLKSKMDNSLNEIDATISQFLSMAGGMSLQGVEECDVNVGIAQTISKFDHYTESIIFQPETMRQFKLSQNALDQILTNLIENALRFSDNQPVIVETKINNQQLLIRIIDRGPGIAENLREHVFQPFVSVQTGDSSVPGGTGLGLAICQIIARTHQWEIQLDSNKGEGTAATIMIPIVHD